MRSAELLAERLANQRLTGPLVGDPVQVVRELLALQDQDAPIARAMIALRCGANEDAVLQAVAAGQLVRTHVLRPTWHHVAAEDLRWLLAATSAKVESGPPTVPAGVRRPAGHNALSPAGSRCPRGYEIRSYWSSPSRCEIAVAQARTTLTAGQNPTQLPLTCA